MGYKKGINIRRLAMSGIRGSPFRVVLLVVTISTLLATSSYSADMITLRDRAAKMVTPEKLVEAQRMTREWEQSHPRR